MLPITKSKSREIIKDFAREIENRKEPTATPSKAIIDFRNVRRGGNEQLVYRVPIELLRFRKDNGRIASDVMDYEKNIGPLDETDARDQAIIRGFLHDKDPEKTATLEKSIIHSEQREPAIITCDGFLINGNRRKMVLDILNKKLPGQGYDYMKVVILPGPNDAGGPPTLKEIEQIENRYQLQSDGKSEYSGFDRALSIKRKIELDFSLEEQLRDDPQYAEASETEIKKAVKKYEQDYLKPLEHVDLYLAQFGREGQYGTIGSGTEGRWQAFKDFSDKYESTFRNPNKQVELGLDEDDVGTIQEAAYDIIRLRTIPDMPKVHQIMRDLPKYCRTADGRKNILKIAEKVEPCIPADERFDAQGNPLEPKQIDAKWAADNREYIIYHTKQASRAHEDKKEKEGPLDLLEAAYKKLTHPKMDITAIGVGDMKTAHEWTVKVQDAAHEIEKQLYHHGKDLKKLIKG